MAMVAGSQFLKGQGKLVRIFAAGRGKWAHSRIFKVSKENAIMAGGELVVGALGALIAIGIVGSLFFRRTGINDVMLLILLGIGIGPLTGIVDANALAPFVPPIGALALLMVVFSEGLNLSFDNLRDNAFDVLLLGALCFALTFGGSFAILYFAFSWKLLDALLLAAILCASAPEIIAVVSEEMKMGNKLRQIAKLEAVLADSAAVIVAFSLLGLVGMKTVEIDAQQIAYMAVFVAMLSIVLGSLCALVWHFLISAMYKKYAHLSALAIACFLFAASGFVGGNGVLAVFTFGFFIGNRKNEENLKLFQEEFAFLIRTFFFVYLGMLFVPAQFANGLVLLVGLALSVAIVLARRVSVGAFSFFQPAARTDLVLGSLVQRGLSVAVLASIAAAAYAHAAVPSGGGILEGEMAGAIPPFAPIALVVVFATNLFSTIGVFRHERRAEKVEYEEGSSLAGKKSAGKE